MACPVGETSTGNHDAYGKQRYAQGVEGRGIPPEYPRPPSQVEKIAAKAALSGMFAPDALADDQRTAECASNPRVDGDTDDALCYEPKDKCRAMAERRAGAFNCWELAGCS